MKLLFERSAADWMSQTQGLVIHGLRVKAIDGSTMKTPDTTTNSRRFGRPGSSRGRAAYPQLRIVTLADVGTRLRWPYRWIEAEVAERLRPIARAMVPELFAD